jgi:hypothetical protein
MWGENAAAWMRPSALHAPHLPPICTHRKADPHLQSLHHASEQGNAQEVMGLARVPKVDCERVLCFLAGRWAWAHCLLTSCTWSALECPRMCKKQTQAAPTPAGLLL